jgi:uncharacterized membrane protein YgcG
MAQARRHASALALAAVLISSCAAAAGLAASDPAQEGWDGDTYPNPKRDFTLCGRRGRPSNLCDPDGLLPTFAAAARVEGVILDVGAAAPPYAAAPCAGTDGAPRGYAVAVALMRKLRVREGEAPAAAARRVAAALHAAWGVGSAACDDGVLILLAADQRQVYISTGAGAAGALGDAAAGEVIAAMRPLLRQSPPDFAGAVVQAVTDVGLGLAGRARSGEGEWEWFPVLFFSGVLGMLGWSATGAWRRRREYRRCRGAVRRLAEEQARMRRREWSRPRTCAVCLEELAGGDADGAAGEDESPSAPLLAHESGPLEEADAAAGGDADGAGPTTSAPEAPPTAEGEAPEGLRRRRAAVAAAAEEASSSAAGAAAPAAARTPVTLHCGHTFCRPCLDAWAERATTCPVCRARLDDGAPADAPRGAPPAAGSGPAHRRRGALDPAALDADLAFRLAMLRLRFPGYISADVADGWAAAGASGAFDWERARAFQLADPGVAARQAAAGYGGNATPFGGGGGGGGGGGAGGSW